MMESGKLLTDNDNTLDLPDVRLDNQLCFALYAASHCVEQHYQTLLKAQGITYSQYLVLMALAEEDSVSISNLASRIQVSNATMTLLLRRLEEKELLHRRFQDGNERQKVVSLTEAGRSIWTKSCVTSPEVFSRLGLTVDEADTVIGICKKIAASKGSTGG